MINHMFETPNRIYVKSENQNYLSEIKDIGNNRLFFIIL